MASGGSFFSFGMRRPAAWADWLTPSSNSTARTRRMTFPFQFGNRTFTSAILDEDLQKLDWDWHASYEAVTRCRRQKPRSPALRFQHADLACVGEDAARFE